MIILEKLLMSLSPQGIKQRGKVVKNQSQDQYRDKREMIQD